MAEYKGIDVSRWQGGIDWGKVKASGVQFAMLRSSYGKGIDTKFKDNLKGAEAAGLPVGVYHFTTAATAEEARAEIDWLMGELNGARLGYPVAFDMEDEGNRYRGKSRKELTDIAAAGLERIEHHGYYAMLYTNPDWLENRLNQSALTAYDVWLAAWRTSRPTAYKHGMWQYTSGGSVPGIAGGVDLDIAYKDYPAIMKANGLNGYANKEDAERTYTVKAGDSFWGIAQKQLGDGGRYRELAEYNGMRPTDTIYPGNVLNIPR